MTESKRIDALDAAKGIGILFVVFAHMNMAEPSLTFIYSFHMPLFFILSGMVFHPEKFGTLKSLVQNRIKTLICPYILFCVLGFLYEIGYSFACKILIDKSADFPALVWRFLYSVVWAPYSQKYFTDFNTPLWFVPCLLLVEVMFYLLLKWEGKGNKKAVIVTTAVLTGIGWLMESGWIPFDFSILPWNFSSACFSLGFFAIGYYSFPFLKKSFLSEKPSGKTVLILVAAFVLTALFGELNGKVSIGSRVLHNGFLFYLSGCLGTIGLLAVSLFLQKSSFLKFMGKNSFTVMGSHIIVGNVVSAIFKFAGRIVLRKEISLDSRDWVEGTIKFFIVLIGTVAFVFFYNWCKNKRIRRKENGRAA